MAGIRRGFRWGFIFEFLLRKVFDRKNGSRMELRIRDLRVRSTIEPFQATKLWNEIIYDFCAGIPLKMYRRRFKTHKHCFMACKAVDWLFDYLLRNQVYRQNVSRAKTIKLLRKFVKCGIIGKVKAKDCNYEFRDNRDLYALKGNV